MEKAEQFSTRWALLLSTLGMAIGAGNIWRFPRLAGKYGGAFLIAWLVFLILWSVPLLMVEFSLGKKSRKGPIGAFSWLLGKKYTWMGGFVALCTISIMFYYSVVCGWALKYFISSISGELVGANHGKFWSDFTQSKFQPLVFHLISLGFASIIIYKGIQKGIERANRILLPSLLVLLILGVVRALTLPGSAAGLNYLFGVDLSSFKSYEIWLEALSQSAWSTGAGWGLVLTYSVYMREKEDITLNAFITGFGNNTASLLAGLAIIPTIFSLSATVQEAEKALEAGNQGLTFIVIPQLFGQIPGGQIFASLFFLGLFFAAISSLISMLELSTRTFIDFGLPRKKALPLIAILAAILGIPSAVSLKVFNNQDWVWGLGLIISGAFFTFAVLKVGANKFREKYIFSPYNDLHIGPWFNWILTYVIPFEAIMMLLWWFYQSVKWDPGSWWNPFNEFSLGTCLVQWSLLVVILLFFNSVIYRWMYKENRSHA
jgi:NSS family neurotransmitter:Na+ symporter